MDHAADLNTKPKLRLPARSLPEPAPEPLDARDRTVQSAARPTVGESVEDDEWGTVPYMVVGVVFVVFVHEDIR